MGTRNEPEEVGTQGGRHFPWWGPLSLWLRRPLTRAAGARPTLAPCPAPPQLFVDKDTLVNAVGASHDVHLLKIDSREDELVTKVHAWCTHLLDQVSDHPRGAPGGGAGGRGGGLRGQGPAASPQIHRDEIARNRKRVKEISQYADHAQRELDALECAELLD